MRRKDLQQRGFARAVAADDADDLAAADINETSFSAQKSCASSDAEPRPAGLSRRKTLWAFWASTSRNAV